MVSPHNGLDALCTTESRRKGCGSAWTLKTWMQPFSYAKPWKVLCEKREDQILWSNFWSSMYPARHEKIVSFATDVCPLQIARNCRTFLGEQTTWIHLFQTKAYWQPRFVSAWKRTTLSNGGKALNVRKIRKIKDNQQTKSLRHTLMQRNNPFNKLMLPWKA